jgi:hypothetical protein
MAIALTAAARARIARYFIGKVVEVDLAVCLMVVRSGNVKLCFDIEEK